MAVPAAPPTEPAFQIGVMPGGQLFTPFIADPRWPHFGASYQYYLDDPSFRNVAAVSLGESFMLYRDRLGSGWWEVGVQAGVFSVFDLDASSFDASVDVAGLRPGQYVLPVRVELPDRVGITRVQPEDITVRIQ